ncbi:MAG: Do family serine endopeptidase [Pirellulaceae bacterium]|nr:Do family serine endopeptidase [Planctomycetales bacterium]MCA9204871.1 Do family serine endopeptidase [Planctomycetales bacterium]MCA9226938.1 Do family serine endopeptidase [Planctomycetales bacterium]
MQSVSKWKTGFGLSAIATALLGVGGWLAAASGEAAPGTTASPRTVSSAAGDYGTRHAKALSTAFRETSREVLPAVVMIKTSQQVAQGRVGRGGNGSPDGQIPEEFEDLFRGSPFEHFFRGQPELRRFHREMPRVQPNSTAGGIGSGVIIDSSGLILTNNHVVDGGDVLVRLHDGREFKAVEVKTDPKTDIAIVKIDGENLPTARLGNSDAMEIGDWVLALGQPFGLEGTVTAGIVSAKGRGIGITDRESFIQTDAAINPGNSGGPLVNLDGEVVGINTAISSTSGGNHGIGFAVPINLARWVADQLATSGTVKRAFLGVGIQQVTADLAKQFNVPSGEGVVVTEVRPDSPAAKAGLKQGDVIVQFNGRKVTTPAGLQVIVEQSQPGQKQPVEVIRDGKRLTLSAVPREQSSDEVATKTDDVESSSVNSLGLEVTELTGAVAKQLGLQDDVEGVVITGVDSDSLAASAGLSSGMVVTEVNRQPVRTVAEFKAAVKDFDAKEGVLLLVRTDAGSRFVVIRGE